jgi:hypothetical protein
MKFGAVGGWPTQLGVSHSIAFCAIEWGYSTADLQQLRKQKAPLERGGPLLLPTINDQ